MALPSDRWLAGLIGANLDSLADNMAAHAKERTPAHRALDPAAVHSGFVAFYRALAAEVATGDPEHMRAHLARVIPVRLQAGAHVDELVGLVDRLEGEVVDLLQRTDATDHAHVAAARPHLERIHKNVRGLVREVARQTGGSGGHAAR